MSYDIQCHMTVYQIYVILRHMTGIYTCHIMIVPTYQLGILQVPDTSIQPAGNRDSDSERRAARTTAAARLGRL
jgi:hypothetical protein